jgi:hypothetical protein
MRAESRELIRETYSDTPIATGTPPISPSARLVSTDLKESGVMAVAGRGTAEISAHSAPISQPATSSPQDACSGMGWLDGGPCWFGPGVFRGIKDSAPG